MVWLVNLVLLVMAVSGDNDDTTTEKAFWRTIFDTDRPRTTRKEGIFGIKGFHVPFKSAYGECALIPTGYMPFAVRVADFRPSHRDVVATGSIITPIMVLTVCTPFPNDTYVYRYVNAIILPGQSTPVDTSRTYDKFVTNQKPYDKTNGTQYLEKPCAQVRNVVKIYRHVKCYYHDLHPQTERYNFAVLRIHYPFWASAYDQNHTYWDMRDYSHLDLVPMLPLTFHPEENVEIADVFNSKKFARCQIPRWQSKPFRAGNNVYSFIHSIPLRTYCAREICRAVNSNNKTRFTYLYDMALCMNDVLYVTGIFLCGRLVDSLTYDYWEESEPKDYDKYLSEPPDVERARFPCKDHISVLGAPVMCRGAFLGIVTACFDEVYLITTILPAWNFVLRFVTTPRLPEVFMQSKELRPLTDMPPYWGPELPFDREYNRAYPKVSRKYEYYPLRTYFELARNITRKPFCTSIC